MTLFNLCLLCLYAVISVLSRKVTAISFFPPTVIKSTMLLQSRSSNSVGGYERRFDLVLRHMGSFAAFLLVPILAVAAVNHSAVLVGGVPNLGAEPSAAVAAFYPVGKNAHTAVL